jgi:uncharacterized protein DUF3450
MNPIDIDSRLATTILCNVLITISCSLSTLVYSSTLPPDQTLDSSLKVTQSTNLAGKHSQQKIDQLQDRTDQLLEKYSHSLRKLNQFKVNNEHLQQMLVQQAQQKVSLIKQLATVESSKKEIVPLMLDMIDTLEVFIQQDIPFLPEERHARIASLRTMMISAETSLSEKYRRILEAYETERAFGYTLKTYQTEISLDESQKQVNILRVGRIGLYYQTQNSGRQGFWNQATQKWQSLNSDYQNTIQQGILIASEQATPDLLRLPVIVTGEQK